MAFEGKNVLFGAGTIHKNLTYASGSWNFADSIVGATSGGSKLEIIPTITELEIDCALVPIKGLTHQKTGESATMEINFIELTNDVLKAAMIASIRSQSDVESTTLFESKARIETGDYWTNVAFVGKDLNGDDIIAILPNALCTSGLSLEGKDKEAAKPTLKFVCTADPDTGVFDTLPWKIYRKTV